MESMNPLIMDRVGSMDPLFLQVEVASINYDLMTLDDTLRDGFSFGKPCTSLIAHLPPKLMLISSFSLLLEILKHISDFQKYNI